jgi:amidase
MKRTRLSGLIRRPTPDEIRSLAETEYMNLTDDEVSDLATLIDGMLREIDRLDDLSVPEPEVKYRERDKGYRPTAEEDPYNVFIRKCLVKGASEGKLAGKRAGLKDSIRVAGIPMTNASHLIAGFVPGIDATVAERLLDAGATIVGKLNMDNFSMGGTSETSDFGSPRNPRNPDYSAGGSSGGSAAAVAAEEVDIALGVDEGGSARIPASWCGVVSIKPTHGLVPSFGITYLDHTIDYVCPIARTVRDVALTLEAIAGDDAKDPQWVRGPIAVAEYSEGIDQGVAGLRIGIIKESLGWPESEHDVDEAVRTAVRELQKLGASAQEISLPWWRDFGSVLYGILCHSVSAMVESDLEGYWRGGLCDPSWQDAFGKARRSGSDGFPTLLKVWMVLGKYLRRNYSSVYFSKAQNLRLAMAEKMDQAFQQVDVLATPTTPMKAIKLTEVAKVGSWQGRGATDMNRNTCPSNLTGHPALTVPCGFSKDGLPIGLQLIGRRWEESALFRAAFAYEGVSPSAPLATR